MRIGMPLTYSDSGFRQTAEELVDYERAGLDLVLIAEAYSFDSVSQLGYLAAKTERIELVSGIFNIYSRTPSLLAMTAAGLDEVSNGRFTLGVGASGPQVVEGFHGVAYGQPLARTREVVDICRKVWRREVVEHDGKYFQLPLSTERGGNGLGKALKLINHPQRDRIPMMLAALGPKNVELAAELFEAWQPIFYYPEQSHAAFGDALSAGLAKRDASLGTLDIFAESGLLITEDEQEIENALQGVRHVLALYVGGMGARDKNFYNDLTKRYGFPEEAKVVQDLYLDGKKMEAAAALPDELVRGISLVGPADHVAERLAAYAKAGITTLTARPIGATHERRLADIEALSAMARAL
jgi:F420-dependent oxidoreductase-like protein